MSFKLSHEKRLEILSKIQPRLLKISSIHEAAWIVKYAETKVSTDAAVENLCLECVARREKHEPLAYIMGSWAFRHQEFFVGPGVLIPRPETEELVEAALMSLENSLQTSTLALERSLSIFDLGAGSGCIGISLLCDLLKDVETETGRSNELSKNYKLHLVEESKDAFSYLEKNIESHRAQLKNVKVEAVLASWNSIVIKNADLILSNPPYITEEEFGEVEDSVRLYEPKSALVPSDVIKEARAFGPYKEILNLAKDGLNSGGWIWFEMGQTQPEWIVEYAKNLGVFNDLRILRDMNKKYRFFCARKS